QSIFPIFLSISSSKLASSDSEQGLLTSGEAMVPNKQCSSSLIFCSYRPGKRHFKALIFQTINLIYQELMTFAHYLF
ncbi:MAG TPA: hypothetical protein DCW97_04080, partial [Acidobacteria bacterium]|nr:hypothetical protein [Acidobacteriota bacterium]